MPMHTKNVDDFTAAQINAMPRSARPIGVRKLTDAEMHTKYADRVRHGKTAKSRARKG